MTEHTAIARRLRAYYEGLITLKEDRTTYIKAQDVLSNYETLCELLKAHEEQFGEYEASDMDGNGTESEDQLECKLVYGSRNALRETQFSGVNLATAERLLHDCFLLISLFYLTIGKNNEPPATYALPSPQAYTDIQAYQYLPMQLRSLCGHQGCRLPYYVVYEMQLTPF